MGVSATQYPLAVSLFCVALRVSLFSNFETLGHLFGPNSGSGIIRLHESVSLLRKCPPFLSSVQTRGGLFSVACPGVFPTGSEVPGGQEQDLGGSPPPPPSTDHHSRPSVAMCKCCLCPHVSQRHICSERSSPRCCGPEPLGEPPSTRLPASSPAGFLGGPQREAAWASGCGPLPRDGPVQAAPGAPGAAGSTGWFHFPVLSFIWFSGRSVRSRGQTPIF